jgi:lysophospholipid acyltransferase (LPLAT)-like uncharacterized protein
MGRGNPAPMRESVGGSRAKARRRPHISPRVTGVLGSALLRSLFATTRVQRKGQEVLERMERPVVFTLWHGHLLPLIHYHRNSGMVTLVSQHRDGEHVARVLEKSGFVTVRGSSTRGGVLGLRGLVRKAREGCDVAITPDGPQGPRRRFKPGALLVARLTGHPIVPVAAGISRAWNLGKWDRFLVPKPFATVKIAYGTPMFVPRREEDESTEDIVGRLEQELERLSRLVGDPE